MGSILSQMWTKLSRFGRGDMQFKIIIVGMNNAGKTTILYKLALNEVIVTEPTIGSNVEEVQHRNLKLQVWDLGGQENLRASWDAYYQDTSAVIFVIDSADDSQVQTSKAEFLTMLVHNELKDAVLLIFANKADMPTARDPGELTEIYGFNEI
jgi:ADP-ribosylation factor-like protein 5B